MQAWKQQQEKLAEQYLAEIKAGKYANGYELYKAKSAENFGVSPNNAVRQFENFAADSPVACRGMAELLHLRQGQQDLRDYSAEERDLVFKFLWVAHRLVRAFTVPTSRDEFYQARYPQ